MYFQISDLEVRHFFSFCLVLVLSSVLSLVLSAFAATVSVADAVMIFQTLEAVFVHAVTDIEDLDYHASSWYFHRFRCGILRGGGERGMERKGWRERTRGGKRVEGGERVCVERVEGGRGEGDKSEQGR